MSATAVLPTDAAVGTEQPYRPHRKPDASWRYRMMAQPDPGLLPRVVAPIAKLGLVPQHCRFDRRTEDLVEVELSVSDLTPSQAEHLRLVFAVMPMMRAVSLTAPDT